MEERDERKTMMPVSYAHLCFVENISVASAAERVEQVYLFHWNRAYPGDLFFDLPLEDGWELTLEEEFPGSSHETITLEVYERA